MKTLGIANLESLQGCLKFKHPLLAFLTCMAFAVCATDVDFVTRKPASIEEEVLTIPISTEGSIFSNDFIFAEDDAGVMKDMKDSLRGWEEIEEYARVWDLESTGLYNTPTASQKGKFIAKKMLRYADKRLSGEMKRADEGSTLYKVGKVEKQLRPNASVNVTKNFGLKFKARVLQGKAIVEVKNPWIDLNATVSANGRAKVITKKEFKQLGLASGAEYSLNDSMFLAYVDQQVTNNIKARLSSLKKDDANIFSDDADARLEMMASFPFNL